MATTTTQWILELVDKITGPMKELTQASRTAGESVDGVGQKSETTGKKLREMSNIDLFAIHQSVTQLKDDFNALIQPGVDFEAQLKDLEALTGVTGTALQDLGEKARASGIAFGVDASAMVESYKGVLSRLGPDVAKNGEALEMMGNNIATLSKTMGGDATGAMDALTTSMLQFGVDTADPIRAAAAMTEMMNVMAASAKEGAAEVPQITEAIKVAGVEATNQKVSFEETNAAIQALAQGGKYGAEAGTALRNVMGKMAGLDVLPKDAQEKLWKLGVNYDVVSDKTLPFTTRLRELSKAQADATLVAQLFGVENAAAANILLRSIPYQEAMAEKIHGTQTATEQADIVMSGFGERMKRTEAWVKDLGISFFNAVGDISPFVNTLAGGVSVMANLANARQGVMMLLNVLGTMPVISTLVSGGFGAMSTSAMGFATAIFNIPFIGWIAAAIAGLTALSAYFYETSSTFRGIVWGVWEFIKSVFTGIFKDIWAIAEAILKVLQGVFDPRKWFDTDFKFADIATKLWDDMAKVGADIGGSFAKGYNDGMKDYWKENPMEAPENAEKVKKLKQLEEQKEAITGTTKADEAKRQAIQLSIDTTKKEIEGSAATKVGGDAASKKGSTEIKSVLAETAVSKPTTDKNKSLLPTATSNTLGSMGGGSIGGTKSITQKIEIKNYFTVSAGTDVRAMAEKLVGVINERLRDGVIAITN
jgi:TP901 family phage tail tape measure protein